MHSMTYLTLDRDVRQLRQSDVDAFTAQISGGVLSAADAAYDDARKVWNGTVDRRPALIARCLTEGDVQAAVRFAGRAPHAAQRARRRPPHRRQRGRRGRPDARPVGHAERSASTPPKRTARVGAGRPARRFRSRGAGPRPGHAARHQLDHRRRRADPGRRLRLADAPPRPDDRQPARRDGRHRRRRAPHGVSATREPDLFWALRGGGGNFGVVTSFEFQLHPVGPEVYAGLVVYPFAQARQVLRAWRDFTADAPGRAERMGGAAQGAAAAVPAGRRRTAPRSSSSRSSTAATVEAGERAAAPVLTLRRSDRHARSGRRPTPASRPRSIRCSTRGRAQLLEVAQLQRAERCGARPRDRRRRPAAGAGVRDLHGPARRRDGARAGGRHRVRRPRCALHHERARPLVRSGRRRAGACLGAAARSRTRRRTRPAAATSTS